MIQCILLDHHTLCTLQGFFFWGTSRWICRCWCCIAVMRCWGFQWWRIINGTCHTVVIGNSRVDIAFMKNKFDALTLTISLIIKINNLYCSIVHYLDAYRNQTHLMLFSLNCRQDKLYTYQSCRFYGCKVCQYIYDRERN